MRQTINEIKIYLAKDYEPAIGEISELCKDLDALKKKFPGLMAGYDVEIVNSYRDED